MTDLFTTIDLVIFVAALVSVMAVGLFAGRRESDSSEQYFLAGRHIPWWGVAGSIYGSNVSANHMVGMMGIGFSIGFAQSHFELGAIFGLLMLCYGFLPVYRRLRIYTLSEYLGRRYDDRSRLAYAVIMVLIMAGVQMVPGLYIGARSACVMVNEPAVTTSTEVVETIGDRREVEAGRITSEELPTRPRIIVDMNWYAAFVIALAVVSAVYTVLGGLRAVVWTDAIQSVLLLAAGVLLAVLTFTELSGTGQLLEGWNRMLDLDAATLKPRMRLYMPSSHPQLPWTGVLTGLMFLHCFYWGTNQFIVQRALGARSDREARIGIISAGFLKLLIPFFAVATGIAGYYLFEQKLDHVVAPDTAFPELVKLVVPAGIGLVGLIAAGLIGAILSSIDSMMNSAATIFTIDVYQKYIRPEASDRQLVRAGRIAIVVFVVFATALTFLVIDPNSNDNFFLQIVDYSGYLTPGLLVAFLVGMFWSRATAAGALTSIVAGVAFSALFQAAYDRSVGMPPAVYNVVTDQAALDSVRIDALPKDWQALPVAQISERVEGFREQLNPLNRFLGPQLNFFHRVVAVIFSCLLVHVVVSYNTTVGQEQSQQTWTALGGHQSGDLARLLKLIVATVLSLALIAVAMASGWLSPSWAAVLGAIVILGAFAVNAQRRATDPKLIIEPWWKRDRLWAAVLCATAVWMHFYFA
ncbi:MAG: hypothetical protein CMJ65_04600 [Planctomycetaceae bacterium]|jgi:SSS family solute:Na+ symporter|nr:hypothetical protein [Planctomycetaceae bacterium]